MSLMQINRLPPLLTLRQGVASPTLSLRLGDRLLAKVLSADPRRLILDLEGNRVEARSSLALRAGQTLELEVTQLRPAIVLRLSESARRDAALAEALRGLLPRPAARAPLTASLIPLLARPAEAMPAPLREALAPLLSKLPRAAELARPQGLRQALAASGLMLESRLLGASEPATGDLKHLLLQLRESGRDPGSLAELGEAAEGALSRIQLLQLHAASSPRLDLLFELPVLFGAQVELLQLRIEEDDAGSTLAEAEGSPEPGWQLRLGFGFPELGRLDALLRLRGNTASVLWWAQRPAAAARLQEALPLLQARLQELGLEILELSCLDGPAPPLDDLPLLHRPGLLHERA